MPIMDIPGKHEKERRQRRILRGLHTEGGIEVGISQKTKVVRQEILGATPEFVKPFTGLCAFNKYKGKIFGDNNHECYRFFQ
jgi:hypothetical protein